MAKTQSLSDKSRKILSLIAAGCSYDQIVNGQSDITYLDIFQAAKEALQLNEPVSNYQDRLAQIKVRHHRAYAPWAKADDAELVAMQARGQGVQEMATHFQRQPSAIRARLAKLIGVPKDKLQKGSL
ncbi:MAG: hypothetical protein WC712_14410 [Candidatus Brocadiia bacterium]